MPAVSSVSTASSAGSDLASREPEVKKVFQEFAAGTFYREMLGSLRKGTGKPAYFHGGYAEDVFRSEMDRHIADDLAAKHGEAFAGPLYENFAQQVLGAGRQ